jgi:hypothetical protein
MRTTRLLSLAALTAVAGLTLGAARADDLDVPALFGSAKASFEAKKYGKAMADLALIAGEVSRLRVETLTKVMPAAPAGWTADEPEGNAGLGFLAMGGFTQVTRRYAKGDEVSVRAELYADAPTIASQFQMLLANAGMMGGAVKVVTIKGRKAILQMQGDKSGSLTVILATPNSIVKFEGNGTTKPELEALAGAFDLDAVEKAIAE